MPVTLTEVQRIPTSGARAVEPVPVAGLDLIAVPQLAKDDPGAPPGMNGGDSGTELLLLRRVGGRYVPHASLPAPGGEDAEFFRIGDRAFLAVASIRTGSGPYDFNATSTIFEWTGDQFVPFQEVPTFAAKQWKHWETGGRHFLGLAQGVVPPPGHGEPGHGELSPNQESVVYEWTGERFEEFQRIPSQWAYNWHAFAAGGEFFVAHAEHAGPSVLYRWDGTRLQPQQTLAERSGRAFATFQGDDGATFLVVACILAPSRVLRFDAAAGAFTEVQVLDGLGAREVKVVRLGGRTLVIRVNFILGTPAEPRPELDSQVYEWDGGKLHPVATFPTCGGTDVAVLGTGRDGTVELLVSNSLSPDLRFAAHTVRYTLTDIGGDGGSSPRETGGAARPVRWRSLPSGAQPDGPLLPPARSESPELVDLFTTYTASPGSIGAHLAAASARGTGHDPLLVVTGTDIALYRGGGEPPAVQPYRLGNRGFKELAGISHLGPAVATLARLRELGGDDGEWRADAARLLAAVKTARAANDAALWRDTLAVRAFAGREEQIAAMVGYSCLLTERFVERALDDPGYLTMEAVRADFLAGPAGHLPVPFNKIMIATFYLTGMDIAHRLITWLDAAGIDWARAMVLFAGQPGRPTSGVTEESHSVAGIVRAVSRGRLAPERLFIAPHAPVFPPFDPRSGDTSQAAALEDGYRRLWAGLRATGDLGGQMFDGYPGFAAAADERPVLAPGTASVAAKPAVSGPDDWFALVTRLRVVMEDPRQLLSGAVTDYASSELVRHRNDPFAVTVPGLDGEPYPPLGSR